jgi:hypothetical protein
MFLSENQEEAQTLIEKFIPFSKMKASRKLVRI